MGPPWHIGSTRGPPYGRGPPPPPLSGGGRRGGERALVRLHELLLRAARSELHRRSARTRIVGPELDDLAYQAAADAMVAITAKLGQFRGESRFTTWVYRFV